MSNTEKNATILNKGFLFQYSLIYNLFIIQINIYLFIKHQRLLQSSVLHDPSDVIIIFNTILGFNDE